MAAQRLEGTRLVRTRPVERGAPLVGARLYDISARADDTRRVSRVSLTRRTSLHAELRRVRMRRQLRQAVVANKPSLRSRRQRQWTVLAIPVFACVVLLLDGLLRDRDFLRADAASRWPSLLAALLGALAISAAATWLATRSGVALRSAASLRFGALAIGPLSLLPLLFVVREQPALGEGVQELHRYGLPCFFLAYLIAAGSLVALAIDLRRQRSLLVTWQGVALGSAAASWSALALLMHCPGAEPHHLLVGHVLPICALPLLGLMFARHVLRLV